MGEAVDLVKTVTRLDFSGAARPWLEIREIMRVAGGDPKVELRASPIVIDQPEKRRRIVLLMRGLELEQEAAASAGQSVDGALEMIARLNEASEFPSMRQVRHESVFIEPYPLPFHELVLLVKERFLRSNAIVDSATDIGLLFDEHEDEADKHVQIGPMDAEQLRREYLRWPGEGIPDTFLFLALAYASSTEAPCALESLRGFLERAIAWQASEAESIVSSLRAGGR
jgi:hypothetical protein